MVMRRRDIGCSTIFPLNGHLELISAVVVPYV
jgi:hypothetical protein